MHAGAAQELKGAIKELVEFLDANVPRLIAYNVYLSDDGSQMTVVHVHPDSAPFLGKRHRPALRRVFTSTSTSISIGSGERFGMGHPKNEDGRSPLPISQW